MQFITLLRTCSCTGFDAPCDISALAMSVSMCCTVETVFALYCLFFDQNLMSLNFPQGFTQNADFIRDVLMLFIVLFVCKFVPCFICRISYHLCQFLTPWALPAFAVTSLSKFAEIDRLYCFDAAFCFRLSGSFLAGRTLCIEEYLSLLIIFEFSHFRDPDGIVL